MGSQDDFKQAQDFLGNTGISPGGAAVDGVDMLWERSGNIWNLNGIRSNSSMQLFSFDLTRESQVIFFNDAGRSTVLDAIVQEPWAPPGAPHLVVG